MYVHTDNTCMHTDLMHAYFNYVQIYSILHLECHFSSISNPNHIGLFCSTSFPTWETRPRELDLGLRIGIEEMTLQMQQAVHAHRHEVWGGLD